jgi:hypothetical protein
MTAHVESLVQDGRRPLQGRHSGVRRRASRVALLLVALAGVVAAVSAQAPTATVVADDAGRLSVAPPTLTDVQRLQVQVLVQRLEIAQLKARAIEQEFETVKARLLEVSKALEVPGYELNLNTLTYAPKAGPETKERQP